MSRRFTLAPLMLLALAGTALAQSPEGSMHTAPAKPADTQPAPAADSGGTEGQLDADGNYTIKKGDTLWDLSQQYLNNPWYWPKIWADNPAVDNPNWIYPGNRLKISRKAEGAPGEVGPIVGSNRPHMTQDEEPPDEVAPVRADTPDVSMGSLKAPMATRDDSDGVSIGGSFKSGLANVPPTTHMHVSSIITDRELAEAGEITHSIEQKKLLTQYDKVFMKINNLSDVKLGSTYTIFRTGDKVVHPITGKQFGYQTELIGTVDIVGKTGTEAIGIIGPTNDGVLRGDHLAANASLDKVVSTAPNETDLSGIILTTQVPGLTLQAENHVVFIDKGTVDGVKDGNTFTVFQVGDGLEKLTLPGHTVEKRTGPPEAVATLVVFNVSEHSSAALVVKSVREVSVGDRVEMHRAASASVGAGGDAR